jgi:hypothetical protein
MECYVCATRSEQQVAVASCPSCQAGLCLGHVRELAAVRAGSTALSCDHLTWSAVEE